MGDYYTSWHERGSGIFQRTVSYRGKAPTGSVSRTKLAVAREANLELQSSSSVAARKQLYSDLYAQANNSETYNSEDTGHEFLTTTFKCRQLGSLPTRSSNRPHLGVKDCTDYSRNREGEWVPNFGWSSNPKAWVCASPSYYAYLATGGALKQCTPVTYDANLTRRARGIMASSIQNALWAQCPDSISGSLGQDVVDILAFGKQLDKLLTLRSKGVSLYRQYLKFSAKKRRQIDTLVAELRRHPGQGLKSLSKYGSSEYLSWLFQYLPWVEDLQTLLGAATDTYLRAKGSVRKRKIINLGTAVSALTSDLQKAHFSCPVQTFSPDFSSHLVEGEPFSSKLKGEMSGSDVTFDDAFVKLTASVSSGWTQNFEHGAAEPLYELNKKLGLVYPSLIWDLIPWTWLVDWFVNVGKFIDRGWMRAYGEWNCSYAYVTTKLGVTTHGMTVLQTCRFHVSPSNGLEAFTSKQLTSSQWKILTALGLSRRN